MVEAAARATAPAVGGGTRGRLRRHGRLGDGLPRVAAGPRARPPDLPAEPAPAVGPRHRRHRRRGLRRARPPPAVAARLPGARASRRHAGGRRRRSGSTSRCAPRASRRPTARWPAPSSSSARAAKRRLVVAGAALPKRGPLADPAVARIVITSAPDVPVDADAVVRRAALRVGGAARIRRRRRERAGSRPRGALPHQLHRAGGQLPHHSLRRRGGDRRPRTSDIAGDNPLRGRIVLVGGTFADGRDCTRRPTASCPAWRSRPTSCTC